MRDMKESGVAWIGAVPSNYTTAPIGSLFTIKKDIIGREPETVLSITQTGIRPKDLSSNEGQNASSYAHYQIVNVGDFAMNHMDLLTGWIDISKYEGVTSPDYRVFTLNDKAMSADYFLRVFQYYYTNRVFFGFGQGVATLGRWRLPAINFKKVDVPVPPMLEQYRIVAAIDENIGKVDMLIRNVQAQIEKLKAYERSMITEIVTKGLDPTVQMKESGVENLGQIPSHWKVRKLKYIADSFSKGTGITKEEIVEGGDSPCVRYGEIYTKYNFYFTTCATRTNKELLSNPQYFSHGDLLFTTTGELVEEIGKSIVYLGEEDCLAGGDVVIMKHSQCPKFMGFALGSYYAQEQKSRGKAKLKVVHTSVSALGNIYIVLPPMEEQVRIAEHLEKCHTQIEHLISIKRTKIEKLEQYKRSLIYEYVTGKREVS